MAYKKFIKIGDKVYGPYYYESFRDKKTGKVKKRYISMPKNEDKNVGAKKHFPFFKILIPVFLFILIFLFIFLSFDFTGKSILEISEVQISQGNVSGFIEIGLKTGELLPANSRIIVIQNQQEKEFLISDLFDTNAEGNFFIEGFNLTGSGKGIGFSEKIYPELSFEFKIFEKSEEEEIIEEENQTEIILNESNSEEEIVEEDIEENNSEKETVEEVVEEVVEDGEEEIELNGFLTGQIILAGSEENFKGAVSYGSDFVYELKENEIFEIISGSVKIGNESANDDLLEIEISENKAVVRTNFYLNQNFGEDFLKNEINTLRINFSSLRILAEEAEIKLVYENFIFAERKIEFVLIEDEEINETLEEIPEEINETANISLEILKQIPDLTLRLNSNFSLNLDDYFSGAEHYEVNNLSSMKLEIDFRGLNIYTHNESGVRGLVRVSAYLGNESLEQSFLIFVSEMNVSTMQHRAIINQPVKWVKIITLKNQSEPAEIEIPKDAVNISVKTGEDARIAIREAKDSEKSIKEIKKESLITGNIVLKTKRGFLSRLFLTGKVIAEEEIEITEEEDKRIINLSEVAKEGGEIAIEYETPAPLSKEEEISSGKRVTIYSEGEYNYTNILAYTIIPKRVKNENNNSIKIYHYVEEVEGIVEEENENYESLISGNVVLGRLNENISGRVSEIKKVPVNFEAFDLDEDGYIDYLEWNVEHLSEQIYEIIYITQAEHLDENRTFIENVYENVSELDNVSAYIPDEHYLRVWFEKNLTREKDITIYARAGCNEGVLINGIEVSCEIYKKKLRIEEIRRENE